MSWSPLCAHFHLSVFSLFCHGALNVFSSALVSLLLYHLSCRFFVTSVLVSRLVYYLSRRPVYSLCRLSWCPTGLSSVLVSTVLSLSSVLLFLLPSLSPVLLPFMFFVPFVLTSTCLLYCLPELPVGFFPFYHLSPCFQHSLSLFGLFSLSSLAGVCCTWTASKNETEVYKQTKTNKQTNNNKVRKKGFKLSLGADIASKRWSVLKCVAYSFTTRK